MSFKISDRVAMVTVTLDTLEQWRENSKITELVMNKRYLYLIYRSYFVLAGNAKNNKFREEIFTILRRIFSVE